MTSFQAARRAVWFVTRPIARGAHAVALTPAGDVILVRLTYRRGWHLPGGGVKRGEAPEATVLRELREEIGMTAHGAVERVGTLAHRPDFRRGTAEVFRVRDVAYAPPPRSLEVEAVRAVPPHALPEGLHPEAAEELRMAGVIGAARPAG